MVLSDGYLNCTVSRSISFSVSPFTGIGDSTVYSGVAAFFLSSLVPRYRATEIEPLDLFDLAERLDSASDKLRKRIVESSLSPIAALWADRERNSSGPHPFGRIGLLPTHIRLRWPVSGSTLD